MRGPSFPAAAIDIMDAEVVRFHGMIADLGAQFANGSPLHGITEEQLLQGPFADAMTHVGQLALLRRLAGAPAPPENFVLAAIGSDRLDPDQAAPVSPRFRMAGATSMTAGCQPNFHLL